MRCSALVVSALVLPALFTSAVAQSTESADGVWERLDVVPQARGKEAWIRAQRYKVFQASPTLLRDTLDRAPQEDSAEARSSTIVLTVPMPDGTFARFRVEESPVMAPELAAKFPSIKTYAGTGIDDPSASLRADWTPFGFHAQILSPNGTVYVDPFWHRDDTTYSSYFKKDFADEGEPFHCGVEAPAPEPQARQASGEKTAPTPMGPLGGNVITRRKYRLAMAAQGEYTAFYGGTVTGALAGIVTTVNRVSGIYESELAIRLELVGNENLVIYTDETTDPFGGNDSDGARLDENQATLDAVIGAANYDIGHLVNTGGGGLAGPGPCNGSSKASGCTGRFSPQGDPFDVDYVAHEMGHQFGASHTFNGGLGSCSGNRVGGVAYEPGSGSTILAYAGICSSNNLQANSDPYFHFASLTQIMHYVINGTGSTCPTNTTTSNHAPTVGAGSDYTIPKQTPFTLTATGSDTDGNTVLYSWEEKDLGPQANLGAADDGSIPLFRVFSPTTNAWRTFPQRADLVNNTNNRAELLPQLGRTMNFRVVGRDNVAGAGGVDYDDMQLTVSGSAGPFLVTVPNGGENWTGTHTVTWNVASSDQSPVNTANVNIWLSTNGGWDFPIQLATNTPNDGSQAVTMPSIVSAQSRIKVSAVSNVFFDVSDSNFLIGICSTVESTNSWTGVTNVPDNSATGVNLPIVVSGLGAVSSVKFKFNGSSCSTDPQSATVGLSHSWIGDIKVYLISPSGTTNLIINQAGGVNNSGHNFCQTVLDDTGPTNKIQDVLSGGAPYSSTYRPANALSAFSGQSANGTWTVRVTDNGAGDTGTVRSVSLIVSSVVCTSAPAGNASPTVNAGTNQSLLFLGSATNALLDATVTDDGLPAGATNVLWSRQSGPGNVSFGNGGLIDTTATFTNSGVFVLQLQADDGELTNSSTVTITLITNAPPAVSAGTNRTVTLFGGSTNVNLDGTVTDDGLPSGTTTVLWSVQSGLGSVSFGNANLTDTTATFTNTGTFVLQLQANDGALTNASTVQITITGSCPVVTSTNVWTGSVGIPDGSAAGVDIQVAVSGLDTVSGVKFRFNGSSCSTDPLSTTVGLAHNWVGDLKVLLISPSGTTNILMNQPGGFSNSGKNFCQTLLDDNGPTNSIQDVVAGSAPYSSTYRPASPFTTFSGENANGTWIVRIADVNSVDTGAVHAFSLIISSLVCSSAPTPRTLQIVSHHGTPAPVVGTYTNSSGAVLTNTVSAIDTQGSTQYVNAGWAMSGNAPLSGTTNTVTMTQTNDAVLTWLWSTNVQFTRSAGANGSVTGAASGFYTLGGSVTVTAVPSAFYHFTNWTGDVSGAETNANPLVLSLTRTKSVTAAFAENLATNGAPEWWLNLQYPGTNDFNNAALSDTDGDGIPAWAEYIAATQPTNGADYLKFNTIVNATGLIRLDLMSHTARLYDIELSTNLLRSGWQVVTSDVPGTESVLSVTNAPAQSGLHYRIRVKKP